MSEHKNSRMARVLATFEGRRETQRQQVLSDALVMIEVLMESKDVSRTELANRMGVSQGAVTHMLTGRRNFSLEKLSDVLFSFDRALVLDSAPIQRVGQRTLAVDTSRRAGSQRDGDRAR